VTLPRILVVSLGGTITMSGTGGGGIVPTLTAQDLVSAVPQLSGVARLEAVSLFGLPGASLSLEHLLETAALLRGHLSEGVQGAVVVQGTDTIEDTAFVLDLLVGDTHPVVVTGAMRGPQALGADGPANLLNAVRVAAHPQARGAGVLVVLNDEIHAGRFVQKSHTALTSAFTSPGVGPVGLVSEGEVNLLMQARRPQAPKGLGGAGASHVALVSLGLGEDGRMLPALSGLGYVGVVIEGMGAGHIPAGAVDRVADLIDEMPVVLCTRVRGGPIFGKTYGFPGSEIDLIGRGAIPSGFLTASKSRLLLSLLIAAGQGRDAIRSAFAVAVDRRVD
jgi:L-asparaginase